MTGHEVHWQELEEGSEIPSITLEITRDRIVMIVCATRDIFPLHHDAEFARAAGYKAPAVATAFLQGLLARCLTDWAGPEGKIRRIALTIREPNYAGDTITAGGRLIRKYVEDGEHRVDCELTVTNQDGTVTVDARATVILPL